MTAVLKLKQAFDVKSEYGAFYTGGNIEWIDNKLICQTTSAINILDIDTASVLIKIGDPEEEEVDAIQTFTSDEEKIVTSHKSGLLKLWTFDGILTKQWKYIHKEPITKLALKGQKLGSGGADGMIRLWDLQHQVCLLSLRPIQGIVSVIEFHPLDNWIFGSGDDGHINMWNVENGKLHRIFSGHYSKVTCLCFYFDNEHFISAGRDKVIILWNINSETALKIIPVYEAIESIICLPKIFELPHNISIDNKGIFVAIAGNKGMIRIWNVVECKEIYVQENSLINKNAEEGGLAITKLLFNPIQRIFIVVSQEQTIIMHDLNTFKCTKQLIGFSDEILDIVYVGKDDSHLAIATNSSDIKLYEDLTMNCQLLKGHSDIVLAISTSSSNPELMISSSKDNSIRLWLMQENTMQCVGIGLRHTGSVGAVTFGQSQFIVSTSQDTCLKIWQLPSKFELNADLYCTHTTIAHQKDINTVVVSPNNKMIATGSQDKTVKLWNENLELQGVLRGHRRGVWCVRFSPVDQVILSASADATIKLWSIADLKCLKTFETHESSVLRIEFITNGMQFISTGSDGLVKLFNIKTSECTCTLNQHEGRVWALAVKKDESCFITGGSDSALVKWRDITDEKIAQELKKQEEAVLQEQLLQNYLQNDQFLKALKFALKLEKPLHVLKIIQNIMKKGEFGLSNTIAGLSESQKEQLLQVAIKWNTSSKYCQAAQIVLNVILNELHPRKLKPALSNILEEALPYTERHFKRLTQLNQDLCFITYTINCMQPHARIN